MSIRVSPGQLAGIACLLSTLSFAAHADQWQDIQQRKELRCGTFADVPAGLLPEATRLDELRLSAIEERVDALLALGREAKLPIALPVDRA